MPKPPHAPTEGYDSLGVVISIRQERRQQSHLDAKPYIKFIHSHTVLFAFIADRRTHTTHPSGSHMNKHICIYKGFFFVKSKQAH